MGEISGRSSLFVDLRDGERDRERLMGLLTPRYRDDHLEMKGVLDSDDGPIWTAFFMACAMSAPSRLASLVTR